MATNKSKQQLARDLNWKKAQINNAADLLKRQCFGIVAHRAVEAARSNALMNLQLCANDAGIKGNYLEQLPYEQTRPYKQLKKKYPDQF